jgi:hypothetical protein
LVFTHTIPLLFAGADCSFIDFEGVRALVVLPELPVVDGAEGAAPAASVLLDEPDDCRVLGVESRALVVLPEFAPAVGFDEFPGAVLEVLPESFEAFFDFLLLAVEVLFSSTAGESLVGGVALAEGSAAAAFFGLLVAAGVVSAFSPAAVPALSVLAPDFFRDEVADVPEALAAMSVADEFESVFFLGLVFFGVVAVSPELDSDDLAESVESAAGLFFVFFFVAVESLCDWAFDCADGPEASPGETPARPKASKNAVETAVNTATCNFFIAVL